MIKLCSQPILHHLAAEFLSKDREDRKRLHGRLCLKPQLLKKSSPHWGNVQAFLSKAAMFPRHMRKALWQREIKPEKAFGKQGILLQRIGDSDMLLLQAYLLKTVRNIIKTATPRKTTNLTLTHNAISRRIPFAGSPQATAPSLNSPSGGTSDAPEDQLENRRAGDADEGSRAADIDEEAASADPAIGPWRQIRMSLAKSASSPEQRNQSDRWRSAKVRLAAEVLEPDDWHAEILTPRQISELPERRLRLQRFKRFTRQLNEENATRECLATAKVGCESHLLGIFLRLGYLTPLLQQRVSPPQ